MKRPFWKFVVAGVAIYLGLLGTISSLVNITAILTVNTLVQTEVNGQLNDGGLSNDHELLDNPTWTIALNVITLAVSVFYQVGALALIMKPLGQRVFYSAIAVSVLGTIVKTIPFIGEHPDLLLAVLLAFTPGLIIDLVLAGVVFLGTRYERNKQDATPQQEPPTPTLSNFSSSLYMNIPAITGWVAALCIGVLPFWIMGVPGVENDYARGWKMGLDVIMYYPIAWVLVYGVSRFLKKRISIDRQRSLDVVVTICLMIFLCLALLRLGQAFPLIAT